MGDKIVRHVITKPVVNEGSLGVKVYRDESFDRMADVSYEVIEYIFESSAHSGLWAREEGVIVREEQLNELVSILENKGYEVNVYNRGIRKG